jgi:phage shock protein A
MSDVTREVKIQGEAARALLANIRDVIGDDEEMISDAVEGETSLIEAISGAADRVEELDAHCEALEARIKELGERRSRFEDQAARIKAAIHVAMGQAELRKLELPQATISLRAVAPKAEITDEAALPSKFWKAQDPKLDRKAVLDALKAKESVPGAVLSNGGETISIRVK